MDYVQSKKDKVNIDGVCKRQSARQAIEVESTFCWSSLFEVGLTRAPSSMGEGGGVVALCACTFHGNMGQEYYSAQYLTDAQPFQPDLGLDEQGWLASADPAQASSPFRALD